MFRLLLPLVAFLVSITALFANPLPEAGFESDDAYIAIGVGSASTSITSPLQKAAFAKDAARIDAQRQFIEACSSSGAVGGGCRERTSEDTDLQGRAKSAKFVQSECTESQEKGGGYSCRLAIRIEMKGLRAVCARLQKEPAICIR